MEKLLQYHIDNTNKRFDEVKDSLKSIEGKLEDVQAFKIKVLVSSKWLSLFVSGVCGFVTLLVTTALSYFVQLKLLGLK